MLENIHLSPAQCSRIHMEGKLDIGHGDVLVAKQGITEFEVSPIGRIYTDGGVAYCEGERHKKPGGEEVLDLLLVLCPSVTTTYRSQTQRASHCSSIRGPA